MGSLRFERGLVQEFWLNLFGSQYDPIDELLSLCQHTHTYLLHTLTHTRTHTHTHAHTHTHTHTHTHARTHAHAHARTHARTDTGTEKDVEIDTDTDTDTHTHRRTHSAMQPPPNKCLWGLEFRVSSLCFRIYTHREKRIFSNAAFEQVSFRSRKRRQTSEVLQRFFHRDSFCLLLQPVS